MRHPSLLRLSLLFIGASVAAVLLVVFFVLQTAGVVVSPGRRWFVVVVAFGASWIAAWGLSRILGRGITRLADRVRGWEAGRDTAPAPDTAVEPVELVDLERAIRQTSRAVRHRLATVYQRYQELATLFERMVEAVLLVDGNNRIQAVNPAALALLDRGREEEVVGRTVLETVRNATLQQFILDLLAERHETVRETEIVLHGKGSERFLQVHGVRLPASTGAGAILVCNDVTRLKKLESLRREFVANVSHELKTPVTTIKGFLETLRDGALAEPEQAREFVEIALRNSRRLAAIIDDLLLLSRIEQDEEGGVIDLRYQELDDILRRAIEDCRPLATAKDIVVECTCEDGLAAAVNGPLLEQAVVNLVTNAITYSDAGKRVTVTARRQGEAVTIAVCDQGIGIEPVHLPRLFERFYRTDKARSRRQGGTGLGLAIVKHIVTAHRGRITVDSTPGKGSVFTIVLKENID